MTWPDLAWPQITWPTSAEFDAASEITFSTTVFCLGFGLVLWVAIRRGHAVYRICCAIRLAIAALIQIALALVYALVSWYAAKFGLRFLDWHDWWTWTNAVAAFLLSVALFAGIGCLTRIVEALPGISPRHLSTGPGSSRLASRSEQRRARII
jgi:hypothetical protein